MPGPDPQGIDINERPDGSFTITAVPPLDSETLDCVYAASGMASIRSRRNWAGERWPCRSISQLSL
jgi:hypothetical protein